MFLYCISTELYIHVYASVGGVVWRRSSSRGTSLSHSCWGHRLYDETQTGAGWEKTHSQYATDSTGKTNKHTHICISSVWFNTLFTFYLIYIYALTSNDVIYVYVQYATDATWTVLSETDMKVNVCL